MARIIIVSNRLPVTAKKQKDKLSYQQSVGGLATGMSSFHENYECLWVGWPGIAKDELKRALQAYKGTIVIVCHEPEFYEGWITKVWNVEEWSEQLTH